METSANLNLQTLLPLLATLPTFQQFNYFKLIYFLPPFSFTIHSELPQYNLPLGIEKAPFNLTELNVKMMKNKTWTKKREEKKRTTTSDRCAAEVTNQTEIDTCTHLIYSCNSKRCDFIPSTENIDSLINSQAHWLFRFELTFCIQIPYLTCKWRTPTLCLKPLDKCNSGFGKNATRIHRLRSRWQQAPVNSKVTRMWQLGAQRCNYRSRGISTTPSTEM